MIIKKNKPQVRKKTALFRYLKSHANFFEEPSIPKTAENFVTAICNGAEGTVKIRTKEIKTVNSPKPSGPNVLATKIL